MRLPVKAKWKNAHRKVGMNRIEAAYNAHLEVLRQAGEIVDFRYERFKLILADKTTLTPDFAVLTNNGLIELHDCKGGFFPEHNRVKWKVAIDQFAWFTFVLVRQKLKREGGGWNLERFE
jgi:hypothetical protein